MDPQRWADAQHLFEEALARPLDERRAFVDDAAGDAELAALVHGLLAADAEEQAGASIASVVRDAVEEVAAAPKGAPQRLGPYKLVKVLGEGGMGTVYLAERDDDEFLQQVAVKIVRGLLHPERVRQFRTERQILAWLEHPNIARLFDGGTTADGTPYLVMEHVEGAPIDRYCDEAGLGVTGRLRLFLTVCDAVSHAHRSLIVHRDIKPSNIIVTADGIPKLLDFGIARLTQEGVTEGGPAPPSRMMTPFYASPEVVRGEQVTTAADVYALGVLLYELLTGTRPLRFTTMTSEEVERVVCHVDPNAPSAATLEPGEGDDAPEARAARRRLTPATLARRLSGDLDAIIALALHKDPAERYASVEALAADIRMHLARRPVAARPPTWTYVGWRFVVRHRWGVAVAAVLGLMVSAAAVVFSVQAARLAEERDRTARERDTAQQVLDFLTDLFEVSNPDATPNGSTVTARELLDRGADRIDTELAGQPVVQGRLLGTIGTVYGALGAYTRSAALLERALELRRATLGPDAPETATAMGDLAEAYRELARFDEAEALHRDALNLQRQNGAPPIAIATSLNNLGLTVNERGRHGEAEPLLREAIDIWRTTEGDDAEHVAVGLNNLAAVLRQQGRLADAVPLLEQAIDIRRRRGGSAHPGLALVLGHLGQVYNQQGELAKAEPLLVEALSIRQRVYGNDHPDTATARNNLASLLQDEGDLVRAESLYRAGLESLEKRLGKHHPDYAVQLNNLASLLEERGRYAEAERLYRESLAIRRASYGNEHAAVARVQHSLGRAQLALGRLPEAEANVREALAVRERALPPGHFEIGLGHALLGEILGVRGRQAEAQALLEQGLDEIRKAQGAQHPAVADCLLTLSTFFRRTHQPARALALAQEAVAIRTERLPARHWKRAAANLELGAVLLDLGRREDAATLLAPAATALASSLGAEDARAAQARALLAEASAS
ncbi:MAG: serine/threonine-protein kinase [Vicinamibacterales bacterium]